MNKLVSTKQFVILVFILTMALKLFMFPTLILKIAGHDGYITIAICLLIEFVVLLMVLYIFKLFPDMTFYEIMEESVGKILAKILIFGFALYQLIKICLTVNEIKLFFTISATVNISWPISVIPLVALLAFVSLKTIRSIGRFSEFICPYIFLSMVLLMLLFIGNIDFENLLPFLDVSAKKLFTGVFHFPIWYGDFALLFVFMGKVKQSKHFIAWSIVGFAVSSILVIFFSCILFASYTNIPELLDFGHNISNLSMFSASHTYGRFDLLIFSIWIMTVFIEAMVLFYMLTRNISYVFETENKPIISAVSAVVLYVFLVFVFRLDQELYTFSTGFMVYVTMFFEFAMPILILIFAIIKKIYSKQKKEEPRAEVNYET